MKRSLLVATTSVMANTKKLPPPIDPKKEPVTVAVLSVKLDCLFQNVKDLVKATARGTENVLRKEMQEMEKRLSGRIDNVEADVGTLKADVKEIHNHLESHDKRFDAVDKRFDAVDKRFDAVDKRFDVIEAKIDERHADHETRITTLETVRL